MITRARQKQDELGAANVTFAVDDIALVSLEPCDLITAYYTVQFVRPSIRQELINKIYQSLAWGGAFLMFEKVRASDARFQDITTGLYTDYKLEQGYTPEEIVQKSRSLKGVLEPFSTQGNLDLLRRAGFVDVISVMKYVCFEGFLAVK
jgi:tRNA (cmo5U34)-methyltransferase